METTTRQPDLPMAERREPDEEQQPLAPIPSDTSPEEFYAEITRRTDVQTILAELAST